MAMFMSELSWRGVDRRCTDERSATNTPPHTRPHLLRLELPLASVREGSRDDSCAQAHGEVTLMQVVESTATAAIHHGSQ